MNYITRPFRLLIAAVLPAIAMAQAPLVACDLVDQQAASKILLASIKQHSPNRQIQSTGGGQASACVFFAERGHLKSQLLEFPTAADAARTYKQATVASPDVSVKSESGVGDEATWWSIGSEAHGITVRKGKRVLVIDTRWSDGAQANDVRGRIKASVQSMASRL